MFEDSKDNETVTVSSLSKSFQTIAENRFDDQKIYFRVENNNIEIAIQMKEKNTSHYKIFNALISKDIMPIDHFPFKFKTKKFTKNETKFFNAKLIGNKFVGKIFSSEEKENSTEKFQI